MPPLLWYLTQDESKKGLPKVRKGDNHMTAMTMIPGIDTRVLALLLNEGSLGFVRAGKKGTAAPGCFPVPGGGVF